MWPDDFSRAKYTLPNLPSPSLLLNSKSDIRNLLAIIILFVFKLGAAKENFGKKNKSKMDNYIQIKTIGRGTYGVADLVLHKEEQRHYVAKKILIGTLTP